MVETFGVASRKTANQDQSPTHRALTPLSPGPLAYAYLQKGSASLMDLGSRNLSPSLPADLQACVVANKSCATGGLGVKMGLSETPQSKKVPA